MNPIGGFHYVLTAIRIVILLIFLIVLGSSDAAHK
jgi:hypothetical protein